MAAQLRVAGQPQTGPLVFREIVPGLEHLDFQLREKTRDFMTPDGHHARRTNDEVRPVAHGMGVE